MVRGKPTILKKPRSQSACRIFYSKTMVIAPANSFLLLLPMIKIRFNHVHQKIVITITGLEILVFKKGDFDAVQGNLKYSSTIRSIKCEFLVEGARCVKCSGYRRLLRERKCRMEEQKKREISLKSTYKHSDMTRDMLYRKLSLQKTHIESLQTEVERMNREMKLSIDKGVKLNEIKNERPDGQLPG